MKINFITVIPISSTYNNTLMNQTHVELSLIIIIIYNYTLLYLMLNNSIYYFLIANQTTQKEIVSITDNSESGNTISDFNTIVSKAKEILHSNEIQNKSKRNRMSLENHNIYYIITQSNTFYLATVRKNSFYSEQEHLMFELFEDIDNQMIYKLVDKNGELTIVGRQNLKFLIEKYQDMKNESSTLKGPLGLPLTTNDNEPKSKILEVNSHINDITSGMKESVKNMISNVNEMQDLDNKSSRIKDTSFKFHQESVNLERKIQWQNYKMKILIGIVIASVIGFILYIILK